MMRDSPSTYSNYSYDNQATEALREHAIGVKFTNEARFPGFGFITCDSQRVSTFLTLIHQPTQTVIKSQLYARKFQVTLCTGLENPTEK